MNSAVNVSVRGKKIFVGLSGGVDSAVTAALLKDSGAVVTGVFIKGWYPEGMPCTWADDRRDAMRVAAHLRLPFITLDASKEYQKGVIDYLLREYKEGRTPNPDIMCNREVKFGAFYQYAKEQGVDYIATGHYARALHSEDHSQLLRGIDPDKDQSYFLWAIEKAALAKTLFPLGDMRKKEVRELAANYHLPNALKRDSQGICFLGSISVEDFLRNEFSPEVGVAINDEGNTIGTHTGAILVTLGQRIALSDAPAGPWYVIAKDIERNIVRVSHTPHSTAREEFDLSETNWFVNPEEGKEYSAQYRYHGPIITGTVNGSHSRFTPTELLNDTVASGQSLVIYEGEVCVGGGIIA